MIDQVVLFILANVIRCLVKYFVFIYSSYYHYGFVQMVILNYIHIKSPLSKSSNINNAIYILNNLLLYRGMIETHGLILTVILTFLYVLFKKNDYLLITNDYNYK